MVMGKVTHFTARRYTIARYMLSSCVCPSVRHKLALYEKAKCWITQTTPYDSPGTLVFWCQRCRRISNGVTPNGGAK